MAAETRTGGRAATTAVIGGGLAIAVGNPTGATPDGFTWRRLSDLARLETGHTPSRRNPEYWDGDIPWIGIRDATGNHGRTITRTLQTVSQEGIDNSSARVLPAGTVCLSRTASVGYVVVMGAPMATSQDFVNWVCGPGLDPRYLKYVLQADRDALLRFANGSTHQTIYFPEVKAFHALLPPIETQRAIAATLGALDDKIESNRRAIDLAMKLVDAISERESKTLPSAPLGDLASLSRATRSPAALGDALVEHFSLPAFDASGQPECVRASTIKSNKADVASNAVLVSRLNPRIPRMWWVHPRPNVPALASTEFAVLTADSDIELAGIWLAVRGPSFREELPLRVTGTSGSHQRVRPDDLLSIEVMDVRHLGQETKLFVLTLLTLCAERRSQSGRLAALRDTLLPELLSGRIRTPNRGSDISKSSPTKPRNRGGR